MAIFSLEEIQFIKSLNFHLAKLYLKERVTFRD